jgi:hypothetical protein
MEYEALKIKQIVCFKELIEKAYPNIRIELSAESIDNLKYYYSDYFEFIEDTIKLKKERRYLENELSQVNDEVKKNIKKSLVRAA